MITVSRPRGGPEPPASAEVVLINLTLLTPEYLYKKRIKFYYGGTATSIILHEVATLD